MRALEENSEIGARVERARWFRNVSDHAASDDGVEPKSASA
jgi:hypothetical protein